MHTIVNPFATFNNVFKLKDSNYNIISYFVNQPPITMSIIYCKGADSQNILLHWVPLLSGQPVFGHVVDNNYFKNSVSDLSASLWYKYFIKSNTPHRAIPLKIEGREFLF